jgi:hypothetical protein
MTKGVKWPFEMTGGRVAAVRDDRVGDEPFEMESCVVIDRLIMGQLKR